MKKFYQPAPVGSSHRSLPLGFSDARKFLPGICSLFFKSGQAAPFLSVSVQYFTRLDGFALAEACRPVGVFY
ncbi:MAG: hypothetical protein IAE84_17455 [Saprospiraceae bacterium]|nr:hypothetical protein [Saprospiraceae bacterium]